MTEKKNNEPNVISGAGVLALLVALVFGVVYVAGNDRAGDVALASVFIGVALLAITAVSAAFRRLND